MTFSEVSAARRLTRTDFSRLLWIFSVSVIITLYLYPPDTKYVVPDYPARTAQADLGRYVPQNPTCWFSRGTAHKYSHGTYYSKSSQYYLTSNLQYRVFSLFYLCILLFVLFTHNWILNMLLNNYSLYINCDRSYRLILITIDVCFLDTWLVLTTYVWMIQMAEPFLHGIQSRDLWLRGRHSTTAALTFTN